MRTKTGNQRGFTLVEMLVSFAFLAFVVSSSAFLLMASKSMANESRQRVLAVNAARSALEAIKNSPLANITTPSTINGVNVSTFVPADLPGGTMTLAASSVSATIATFTVTVSWNGPRNIPKTLSVVTKRSVY